MSSNFSLGLTAEGRLINLSFWHQQTSRPSHCRPRSSTGKDKNKWRNKRWRDAALFCLQLRADREETDFKPNRQRTGIVETESRQSTNSEETDRRYKRQRGGSEKTKMR